MASPDLRRLHYAPMRWNAPLSEEHAALLLDRLAVGSGSSVLDLGCAWGELLLRAVDAFPSTARVTGIGVDIDEPALERGRAAAAERRLEQRVTFVKAPAETWHQAADRVICIGASQAWGGTHQALTALAALVAPGGRLLFGEGFWECPPTDEAIAIFGNEIVQLGQLVAVAAGAGWRVLHLSTADRREWDDFESTWRAGREEWLANHPNHEQAQRVREELDARLGEYLSVYRGVLGFCYLVRGQSSPGDGAAD